MFKAVKISVSIGVLAFILTWIIVLLTKPKELLKVQDTKKINIVKLLILSILFGSFFTLSSFLLINDDFGTKFGFAMI